jgi:hypothetical protein
MPTGKPGPSADGLAAFLFDKILYSKQVCDRNGQAVGLSQAKRDEYLGKIRYSIEQGLPITASEYLPLVAISNPIKRNTQAPGLAGIDVMRRLAEVLHAVEQHYQPGMRWLVVGRTVADVLTDAKPAAPPKLQRRSHNQTANGDPLVNYNEPDNAGLPHNGRIGRREAEFVRTNLDLVNERRAAGHPPIDPTNSDDARRYGLRPTEQEGGGAAS